MSILCSFYAHMKNKRGQPIKEIKRKPIRITILPNVTEEAKKVALETNQSLSRMVENLLKAEIKKYPQWGRSTAVCNAHTAVFCVL